MAPLRHEPWLDRYDPGVPRAIGTYPDKTLLDFVADHAHTRRDARALVFKGRSVSWHEVERDSDALARALAGDGVEPGDRVAALLPNCPQFVITELAAWKVGAILAPQNPIHTEQELEHSLASSGAETIVVLTPFHARVKAIQPRTALRRVIATSIKEHLPPMLRMVFMLLKEKKEGHHVRLPASDSWLRDQIARGAASKAPLRAARPDEPAVILMSGGTTGTPKGVVLDHRSLVMTGTQIAAWLRAAVEGDTASILLPLPLFHAYGLAAVQAAAIVHGIPLILVPNPRDVDDLARTIDRDRPTLMCGVPALFTALLENPRVKAGQVDFRSVVACFSGAAALLAETRRRFEELTGGRIVEGYSLTEAGIAACVNPLGGIQKPGSVGLPLPDVEVRIVDAEEGTRTLPVGEVGEIAIRAPQLMRGYWNDPAETALVLRRAEDGSVWLHTGDLGRMDEDGYVFLVDRKKDVIKASGYQVWPRDVEEVLGAHPAVAEVGVAGVPDERKGEIVVAWIVPRAGVALPPEQELRAYCRERLAPYKVPARIEVREQLPKSLVGKVLRRALVAQQQEEAIGKAVNR